MCWESIAVNADFWSQVLQGNSFRKMDFALGAVMAVRRRCLAEIGGFRALADCLADDYQLGHRIAQRGYRIAICPVVAQCWSAPLDWRQVWRHQLRWARTIRVCQPLPYFFSILANPTFWPLVWAVSGISQWVIETNRLSSGATTFAIDLPFSAFGALLFVFARILFAWDLQWRLTRSNAHAWDFWLVPIKDLLQVALWAGAFLGNRVEWRGERYRLRRDGTLLK
jgi:ceramide glucosyltransferase